MALDSIAPSLPSHRLFPGVLGMVTLACGTLPAPGAERHASERQRIFVEADPSSPIEPSSGAAPEPERSSRCLAPLADEPAPVPAPHPMCPADPGYPALDLGRVLFDPSGISLDVELAVTEGDRERGLMFRRELAEDRGMLFVFDQRVEHSFWMKNTCIPLDMLFLDDDGFIVGLVENAVPMSEQSVRVSCPSRYVLEVNGGWARRHGIVPGMTATVVL